jgi:hypothetical protein
MTSPFVHNKIAGPVGLRIGEAWHNAFAGDYVSMVDIPIINVPGQKAMTKSTGTYLLEDLDSMIHRTDDDTRYQIGDEPPGENRRAFSEITYSTEGRHGKTDPWPLETPSDGIHAGKYWESYRKKDAQLRGRAYARREAALVAHLSSATYGQEAFTGTEPLIDRDVTGDQQFWRDLLAQVTPVFKWHRQGLDKVAFVDQALVNAITTNMDFIGGLQGSGVPNITGEDVAMELIRKRLGLKKIKKITALVNTARQGQTSAVDYVSSTGLLWVGLLDSTLSYSFEGGVDGGPDGAFAIAQSSSPWVKIWKDEGRETQLAADRDEFGLYAVRGAEMGVCFTQNITS